MRCEKAEYVVFEPEELKAIMPESDRKIRIEKFVYFLSLDPTYFETPYILVPDRSEEAYSLLVTALTGTWTGCSRDNHSPDKGIPGGGACLSGGSCPDNAPPCR